MDVIEIVKKILISPKTAVSLIVLVLLSCLIGFFVPQIADKSPSFFEQWKDSNAYSYRVVDSLQLNRVFTSPWFLALVLMTALLLAYSLYRQVKRNLVHIRTQNTELRTQSEEKITFVGRDRGLINNVIEKRGYQEDRGRSSGQCLVFSKNSIGRWGSIFFHAGLILVIISALIVLCFQKRGFVQLIEGEQFEGKDFSFLVKNKGVLAGDFTMGFQTHMRKLEHTYWESGKLKTLESLVTIIRGAATSKHTVSINNPLRINGTSIYQSGDYGYALSFILRQPTGKEIVSHFTLNRGDHIQDYAVGESGYPLTPYLFRMKFMPDISRSSFHLTRPILALTVLERGEVVFDGLVLPEDAVKIGGDILYFADARYWSGLIFVNNPGIALAYAGFLTVILGAAVIFLLPYKEIHVMSDGGPADLSVSGHTMRYQPLFVEELEEIRKELGIAQND